MEPELNIDYYFDLKNFQYKDLFTSCQHPWNVLPLIESYIQHLQPGYIHTQIPDGVVLVNKESIIIGKGSIVESGAYIQGPCVIGENCLIRSGAYIRGNFICGNNCVIGHATEVKDSLFLDNAKAPHFAYVGNSILGNHTNLGAGTVCSNLRFDHQNVRVFFNGKLIETNLKKFGAIFGDYSQSGCNSVTNPGTLLGKRAIIYPCINVGGLVKTGMTVYKDGSVHSS